MGATVVTFADLAATIAAAPDRVRAAIAAAMPAAAIVAVAGARDGMTAGVSPDGTPYAPLRFGRPSGAGKPLLDTGLMRAALSASHTEDELVLRAGSKQARLMHFGGTVRPVTAKALAIPLTPRAKRTPPRQWPAGKLFLLRTKTGAFLAEKTGKKGDKNILHFVLKASVTVPARPFVGFSGETRRRIERIVLDRAAREILGD
jgi:phage gpG-like protein